MIPRIAANTLKRLAKGFPIVAASDWPVGAHKWQKFAGDDALPPVIVYGGEGGYEREACRVVGWRELRDYGAATL